MHIDNAPCHTSVSTEANQDDRDIFHFKTPAQSPDLNPIELVWHDLKVYIAEQAKSNNYFELVNGIFEILNRYVTIEYCNIRINHMRDRILNKRSLYWFCYLSIHV